MNCQKCLNSKEILTNHREVFLEINGQNLPKCLKKVVI